MNNIKKLEDLGFRISECSIEKIKVAGFKKRLKFTMILEQDSNNSQGNIPEKTLERVGNNILKALRILY
jgi:hypothetical protein